MDPLVESVVRLQESDSRRLALEKELRSVPVEGAAIESDRKRLQTDLEAKRAAFRTLELRSKQAEQALRSLDDKLARLKTQQVLVKKNDEFQALSREIEAATAERARLEEEELGLLFQIDADRAGLQQAENDHRTALAEIQARVDRLAAREAALQERRAQAVEVVAALREPVPAALLATYDRLMKLGRSPAVVALTGQTCGGCHMRVSNEVENSTHGAGKLVACDNCGRLVYLKA